MIKEIYNLVKEDPKTAITDFLATLTIFIFGYGLIWLGAILEGNLFVN